MGDRANHWWMVWCVLLFFGDVSAHVMSARMYKHLGGTQRQTSATKWRGTNELHKDSAYTSGSDRRIVTGDSVCNALVLRGISVIKGISKRRRFDTFLRITPDKRHDILYRASHDPNVYLFYEKLLQKWVIGKIHNDNVSIAIQFECTTHLPEDSRCGAHISVTKGSSVARKYDPSLHLECTNDLSIRRFKRDIIIFWAIFIFIPFLIMGAAGIVKKIQKENGCLFYPSVCEMRDRIKDELVPDVRKLQSTLEAFGNLQQLKHALRKTIYLMDDIKEEVLELKFSLNVYNQLRIGSDFRNSLRNSSFFKDAHFLQDEVISQYKEWVQGTPSAVDELIGTAMTSYELYTYHVELYSSINGKMTGTIVAVGIALVDSIVTIAFSIKEEYDIKEKLQENVAKLSERKVLLVSQKRHLQHLRKIYSKLLPGLKSFTKQLFPQIWRFFDELTPEKINVQAIENVNKKLENILDQIKTDYMGLRDKIESLR